MAGGPARRLRFHRESERLMHLATQIRHQRAWLRPNPPVTTLAATDSDSPGDSAARREPHRQTSCHAPRPSLGHVTQARPGPNRDRSTGRDDRPARIRREIARSRGRDRGRVGGRHWPIRPRARSGRLGGVRRMARMPPASDVRRAAGWWTGGPQPADDERTSGGREEARPPEVPLSCRRAPRSAS